MRGRVRSSTGNTHARLAKRDTEPRAGETRNGWNPTPRQGEGNGDQWGLVWDESFWVALQIVWWVAVLFSIEDRHGHNDAL